MSSVQKKATVVFIPFPMASHLPAAVKAAQLLSGRDDRLCVTVLIMNLPFTDASLITSYIKKYPTLNFLQLPITTPDSSTEIRSPEGLALRWVEGQKGLVKDALVDLNLAGIVVDLFCATMIDLVKDAGIPGYVFFTAGAAFLGLMFGLQSLRDDDGRDPSEYEADSDAAVSVPTFVHPVPARVWPSPVFDDGNGFLDITRKFREAQGIVVNSFLEFEPNAIGSLSLSCDDGKLPPVYPVGPIIQDESEETEEREKKRQEILGWLDQQPDDSVVFLCFGTGGCFEEDQVRRIAAALENSGHRFLWSLRKPPPKGELAFPGEFENPHEILPEGFLDRTIGVGKVIGWAPQMAVLSHPAVGGFVSHCGWNSILESVWCGVPIAVWPLAAEQQVNAFELVKELEIAVEIKMDFRKNCDLIVGADKIEKAIRVLMDRENGIRVKVKELKERSRKVVMEGGSSFNSFGSFINDIIHGIS